jgi:hypothetical protein
MRRIHEAPKLLRHPDFGPVAAMGRAVEDLVVFREGSDGLDGGGTAAWNWSVERVAVWAFTSPLYHPGLDKYGGRVRKSEIHFTGSGSFGVSFE